VFLTPLRKPGSALSPWQVKAIFSEVEVRRTSPERARSEGGFTHFGFTPHTARTRTTAHAQVIMNYTAILLDRVEKKLAAWTHNQCLGEIFLKLVPFPGSPRHHPREIINMQLTTASLYLALALSCRPIS